MDAATGEGELASRPAEVGRREQRAERGRPACLDPEDAQEGQREETADDGDERGHVVVRPLECHLLDTARYAHGVFSQRCFEGSEVAQLAREASDERRATVELQMQIHIGSKRCAEFRGQRWQCFLAGRQAFRESIRRLPFRRRHGKRISYGAIEPDQCVACVRVPAAPQPMDEVVDRLVRRGRRHVPQVMQLHAAASCARSGSSKMTEERRSSICTAERTKRRCACCMSEGFMPASRPSRASAMNCSKCSCRLRRSTSPRAVGEDDIN